MNTSKTQDLKPFRMNTSEKTGEGGPPYLFHTLPYLARPTTQALIRKDSPQ
jgi:hypothetical protein